MRPIPLPSVPASARRVDPFSMDLDGLLKANIELQKRIATDRTLRRRLSMLWGDPDPVREPPKKAGVNGNDLQQLTFSLPVEMCVLLAREVERTGKTPSELIEKSFAEYYQRKHGSAEKQQP